LTDIFREVEEDLRRDKFQELWRRFGIFVVGVPVAVVLFTAAQVGWKYYSEQRREDRGEAYAVALGLLGSGGEGSEAALAALADNGGGYAALARLQLAALLLKQGNVPGALDIYEGLAVDSDADPALRDLAVILIGFHSLESADAGALAARLEPLTVEGKAWRYSALEVTALLSLRQGDAKKAGDIFKALSDDSGAPLAMRQRAAEILDSLAGQS
jgi:hypothetical protein